MDKSKFHEDAAISSEVLNSRISFWWRPLLNDALSDLFHLWSTPPFTNTPTFILFGNSLKIEKLAQLQKLLRCNRSVILAHAPPISSRSSGFPTKFDKFGAANSPFDKKFGSRVDQSASAGSLRLRRFSAGS